MAKQTIEILKIDKIDKDLRNMFTSPSLLKHKFYNNMDCTPNVWSSINLYPFPWNGKKRLKLCLLYLDYRRLFVKLFIVTRVNHCPSWEGCFISCTKHDFRSNLDRQSLHLLYCFVKSTQQRRMHQLSPSSFTNYQGGYVGFLNDFPKYWDFINHIISLVLSLENL